MNIRFELRALSGDCESTRTVELNDLQSGEAVSVSLEKDERGNQLLKADATKDIASTIVKEKAL